MTLAAAIVLVVPAVGGADPTPSADALRRADASLAARSRAATLSLYSLDSQLSSARSRLAAIEARERTLREEQASLARQLRIARSSASISQRRLATHLRQLYERGDVTTVEIVLGARTLDEALTGLDSLDRAAAQDEAVVAQVRSAKRHVTNASAAVAARVASLAAARRAAEATAASLQRAQEERRAYLARLASERELNAAQLAHVEAEAAAARERTQQLAAREPRAVASVAPEASAEPAAEDSGATDTARRGVGDAVTVTVTGYALTGTTATGLPVGWGVAAVDPSVIPLGTRLTIPGYGDAVAADTGGAVVGATIDVWFPTIEQARAWGRRTVTVVVHQ